MKEPWKDGSPVPEERRWCFARMGEYSLTTGESFPWPCDECRHGNGDVYDEPCATCWVRPSGFEERDGKA